MSTQIKPEEPKKQKIDWANIEDDHPEEGGDAQNENKTDQPKKVVQHRNIDGNQPKHKGFHSAGGKVYNNASKGPKGPAKHNPNQTDGVVANIEKIEKAKQSVKPIATAQNIFECDDLENDDDDIEEEEEQKVEEPKKQDNFLKDFTSAKPAEPEKQKEEQLSKKEQKQKEMEEFEAALKEEFGAVPATTETKSEEKPQAQAPQTEEQKEEGADKKKQQQKEKKEEAPAATGEKPAEAPKEAPAQTEVIDKETAIKQALAQRMGAQNNDQSKSKADIEAAKAEVLKRQNQTKQNKNDFDL